MQNRIGENKRTRRAFGKIVFAGVLAASLSTATAGLAQERTTRSALAGVDWPERAWDWVDERSGPRYNMLDVSAAGLGGTCTDAREYHAWNLEEASQPDTLKAEVLAAYDNAGWVSISAYGDNPVAHLFERGAERLVVTLHDIADRASLALFSCVFVAAPTVAETVVVEPAPVLDEAAPKASSPSPRNATSGMQLAVGMIALLAGTFAGLSFLYGLNRRKKATASAKWPEVPALILASDVHKAELHRDNPGEDNIQYSPAIRYSYAFDGRDYEGKRLGFKSYASDDRAKAQAIAAEYVVGETVQVRVNPAKPSEATIRTDMPPATFIYVVPIFIVVFAIVVAFLALKTNF